MAQQATTPQGGGPDKRNLHWVGNNVGSTLLQKMGWTQGQALGSKHRKKASIEGESAEVHSGEGLKILKRPDGLGLGANTKIHNQESTSHEHFTQLLQALNQEHSVSSSQERERRKRRNSKKRKSIDGDDADNDNKNKDDENAKDAKDDKDEEVKSKTSSSRKDKKKRKSSSKNKTPAAKKETVFATNRMTHARVRQSKFAAKSAADLACIFGKEYSSGEIADQTLKRKEHDQRLQKQKEKQEIKVPPTASSSSNKRKKPEGDDNAKPSEHTSSSKDKKDKDEREMKKQKKEERRRKRKEKEEKASKTKPEK